MSNEEWKYKFLSKEKFEEYSEMGETELVQTIKDQAAHQEMCKTKKSGSDFLKDIKSDISDFRKKWQLENAEEWEILNDDLKALREKRDEGIQEAIDERKEYEGGLNDAIKGSNEHIEALLYCLRFHQ